MIDAVAWEYKIEPVANTGGSETVKRLETRDRFNELGRLGWELVCVCSDTVPGSGGSPTACAYFKKPLGYDPERVGSARS